MKELLDKLSKCRIAQEVSYVLNYVPYVEDMPKNILENDDLSDYTLDEIKGACKLYEGCNDGDMDQQLIMVCDDIIEKL